jgi:hypothetical protein
MLYEIKDERGIYRKKKQNGRRVYSQKRMVVENDEIELKQTNVMLSVAKEEMEYLEDRTEPMEVHYRSHPGYLENRLHFPKRNRYPNGHRCALDQGEEKDIRSELGVVLVVLGRFLANLLGGLEGSSCRWERLYRLVLGKIELG